METIHVDPYSTHNTWKEDDGKIWSSFNDFQKGLVTVFNVDPDGKIEKMNGTISMSK